MSGPGPMKSLPKRLYAKLPATAPTRVRSRSLYSSSLAFFDSPPPPPPPPTSRPGNPHIVSTHRLPVDGAENPHQHHSNPPPYSLALTPSHSLPSSPLPPGSSYHGQPIFFPYPPTTALLYSAPPKHAHRAHAKHPLLRFQLDVGAYGIPKRRAHASGTQQSDGPMDLAVQVGEDAYFVRDNAMGVADGVGGWARSSRHDTSTPAPSPSALFARRLMHYCSAEVAAASQPPEPAPAPTPPKYRWGYYGPYAEEAEEMEDEDAELKEGLDVLMILEHAYERTLKAHVSQSTPDAMAGPSYGKPKSSHVQSNPSNVEASSSNAHPSVQASSAQSPPRSKTPTSAHSSPVLSSASSQSPVSPQFPIPPPAHSQIPPPSRLRTPTPPRSTPPPARSRTPPPARSHFLSPAPVRTPEPLMQGSSTALVAVLDYAPSSANDVADGSAFPLFSLHPSPPSTEPQDAAEATPDSKTDAAPTGGAVLRIAHVGDCMGMLVRGEEIVWRSDEMWWGFNAPLQLGPASPTVPADATVLTLPVRADDILVLASDGLSDNLWDEDVLDEVVRFRRAFLSSPSSSHPPQSSHPTSESQSQSSASQSDSQPQSQPSQTQPQTQPPSTPQPRAGTIGRRAVAAMLSEALCSRARRVSEQPTDEIPFARRAREHGKAFRGGKNDDISVIVAVISPAADGLAHSRAS
ncbi:hypothetical protein PLICRDRAFT_57238 [Plicaturopsis crispa FD-325 SS-3]|uniref:Protein phosphatase n=1 Tax=Plicaturopsis crispa FD-325 SS-3 TaxID=944288 RepID=A0A0C9SXZ4_PLICR|nr:hypothetical protein PLICRDRAFT_57238 [Plicaturopsis crispa FD-325 SS-3]